MTPVTSALAARGQTPVERNWTWRSSAVRSHNSQTASERERERERGQPCSQRGWVADQTTRRDKVGSKLQLTPKKSHRGVRAKKHIIQHHAGTLHSVRTQGTQARPPLIGLSGINCEEAKGAFQTFKWHQARRRKYSDSVCLVVKIPHRPEQITGNTLRHMEIK